MLYKYLFALLFSTLFFVFGCDMYNNRTAFEDIRAITGKWSTYKGVKFNENWQEVEENRLEGIGFSLNGKDTVFSEKLILSKVNDTVIYSVILNDANKRVDFKLKESSKYRWLFFNEVNEYPSKIIYEIENDTLLTVITSDKNDNRKQYFYLSKTN